MIIKNIKNHPNLTLGKDYVVIGISTGYGGEKTYNILDDNALGLEDNTKDYFLTISYPEELFEIVNSELPKNWITKETKKWKFFGRTSYYTTFDFLINDSAFFARMVDGSEPERSYFYYALQDLYKMHNLNSLVPTFEPILQEHLKSIEFPRNVVEDWVDTIDGKLYKSNN